MSNERAQARDNETTFGYGRPPVLTGALSLVALLQRTRGPSQIATPAPGSAKSHANIDSGRDQGAAASPSRKWGSCIRRPILRSYQRGWLQRRVRRPRISCTS